MPEETSSHKVSQQPTGDALVQSPGQPPGNQGPPSPPTAGDSGDDNKKLERDIRTGERLLIGIGVATVLVNIGIWHTYSGQLNQMTKATRATEQAAYAACVATQISRDTLVEIRTGGADTHNLAVGSITQASAVTRAEAAQIVITREHEVQYVRDHEIDVPFDIDNIGKSSALDVKVVAEVQILKVGEEPSFRFGRPPMNHMETGTIFPDKPDKVYFFSQKAGKRLMFDDANFDEYPPGRVYISVFGRVSYRDIFGVSHWTDFCVHDNSDNANGNHYPKCAAYNRTDMSPLPQSSRQGAPDTSIPQEISCQAPK